MLKTTWATVVLTSMHAQCLESLASYLALVGSPYHAVAKLDRAGLLATWW